MIEFGKINDQSESPEQVSFQNSNSLKRRISQRKSSLGWSYFETFAFFRFHCCTWVSVGWHDRANVDLFKYPCQRRIKPVNTFEISCKTRNGHTNGSTRSRIYSGFHWHQSVLNRCTGNLNQKVNPRFSLYQLSMVRKIEVF